MVMNRQLGSVQLGIIGCHKGIENNSGIIGHFNIIKQLF